MLATSPFEELRFMDYTKDTFFNTVHFPCNIVQQVDNKYCKNTVCVVRDLRCVLLHL